MRVYVFPFIRAYSRIDRRFQEQEKVILFAIVIWRNIGLSWNILPDQNNTARKACSKEMRTNQLKPDKFRNHYQY